MKKYKLIGIIVFFLGFSFTSTSIINAEQIITDSIPESVKPLADDIGWIYKSENGKLYKRQFNYSKGIYIGPWILV